MKKNFTIIHNEVLGQNQLSIQARFLLIVLIKHCGQGDWCYPSQQFLAETLGFTGPRQVRTILKELIDAGLVNKERSGFNKPNTYKVAKEFVLDGKRGSYHLGSKFPLHTGTTDPPNSTYRKAKVNKGMMKLGEKIENLGLRSNRTSFTRNNSRKEL